ncbi:MAG: hypothetical protein PHX60_15090 [Giesbergeria sp.]|uniref:hypothetical protein n=1 Tax=Giesbergeria sp. TaxID=2818473 RepID=UPI002630A370|nr:hypothetical protein [Giesbergeria sp.]MDD2610977.1 hypothetical protein [Giesbergeria sp.]
MSPTKPSMRGGARLAANASAPSLHLAPLLELLAKALAPTNKSPQTALPLVAFDGSKLVINTRGVLMRLYDDEDFIKQFTPSAAAGFVRDLTMPRHGTTARVGGRLLHGSDSANTRGIEKLQNATSAVLDKVLEGVDLSCLTVPSLNRALQLMAHTVNEKLPLLPQNAALVPVVFASNERKADERRQDIGKVLTAIETVEGPDRLVTLCNGIAAQLHKQDADEEDIEETVREIMGRRHRPGDQIRQFLEFLDDGALSRVRLQVMMNLMEALATQSNKSGFKAYVARIKTCFEMFAGVRGVSIELNPSSTYGASNIFQLGGYVRQVFFYNCLPVWVQCSAQLFETCTESATQREVSYRFRVNGDNPHIGKSAFLSRLDQIRERLEEQLENHRSNSEKANSDVRREIAELVFLFLVVPDSLDHPSPVDIEATTEQIAKYLQDNPEKILVYLQDKLEKRHATMDGIADELVNLLRHQTKQVIHQTNHAADKFTVSVHRGILNLEALDCLTSNTNILAKAEQGQDAVAWFEHLTVSQESIIPGSLMSYVVRTQLKERSLAIAGDAKMVTMRRELQQPVLPVRFVPFQWLKREQQWVPDAGLATTFDTGHGIDVQYDLKLLQLSKDKNDIEKAKSEQLRAASISAFTITVYVLLWELQRRVRAAKENVSISMLRLQQSGRKPKREDEAKDPNTAIYAISHALETTLAREGGIQLQGLTTIATKPGDLHWKRVGALNALLAAQPIKFDLDGTLDKVALVTYVTRPCDSHPEHTDADGYLFISRTYTAERTCAGATLRVQNMRSRLLEKREEFKNLQPILEEIARLRAAGYRHVMLLSHHFGNRHIGRAAERHAPHGTLEFLDAAMQRFPELHLYPLRRDVFPATRLRRRSAAESGFEVVNFKDHQEMYQQMAQDALRSVMPIYTFATLKAVGDDKKRPQSGFCTYFYDAEQRVTNIEAAKTAEMNILGLSQTGEVQKSLVSILRAIHFLESEKPSEKSLLLPVLDPFSWVNPTKNSAVGEIEIMSRRGSRAVLLSLPAVLAHVTKVLHKEVQ